MKIIKYNDPAHGWAKVKRSKLEILGIADKITSCSYQRGEYVYLEEDCDLSLFVNTIGRENVEFKSQNTNKYSKIRNYDSYQYMTPKDKIKAETIRKILLSRFNWRKRDCNNVKKASLSTLEFWAKHYSIEYHIK